MGEDNDAQRPGFDYWMSHRGQGNYFDTEFNIDGTRRRIKGYYTTVVTDDAVRVDSSEARQAVAARARPQGPARRADSAGAEVREGVRRGPGRASRSNCAKLPRQRRQAEVAGGEPRRRGTALGGPLYGQKEYGKFVRAYLGTLRRWTTASAGSTRRCGRPGQLDNTLIVFTTDNGFVARRARPRGQADDVRGEHARAAAGPLPAAGEAGHGREGDGARSTSRPTLLDVCGAKPLADIHGRSWKPLLAGTARRTGGRRSSTSTTTRRSSRTRPNVRGVRTGRLEVHPLPARRRQAGPVTRGAVRPEGRPARDAQPDRRSGPRRHQEARSSVGSTPSRVKPAPTRCPSTPASSMSGPVALSRSGTIP